MGFAFREKITVANVLLSDCMHSFGDYFLCSTEEKRE